MTKFLEEKWKKNDNLMKAALKKMHLKFTRRTVSFVSFKYIHSKYRDLGSRCKTFWFSMQ